MEVPAATPVITPFVETIVALLVLLLCQVPLGVPSVNVVEAALHIVVVPDIAPGVILTVTILVCVGVAVHPVVYEITVVPGDTLVTSPPVPTVATEGVELLHVP